MGGAAVGDDGLDHVGGFIGRLRAARQRYAKSRHRHLFSLGHYAAWARRSRPASPPSTTLQLDDASADVRQDTYTTAVCFRRTPAVPAEGLQPCGMLPWQRPWGGCRPRSAVLSPVY
ncbi:hypothetical protein ABZV14_16965 [Streptosporangium canum]|uniref:hypothetical protein n=1 Tax=Streptosporangium canum TaxID=324952 RepID=UPI0033B57C35